MQEQVDKLEQQKQKLEVRPSSLRLCWPHPHIAPSRTRLPQRTVTLPWRAQLLKTEHPEEIREKFEALYRKIEKLVRRRPASDAKTAVAPTQLHHCIWPRCAGGRRREACVGEQAAEKSSGPPPPGHWHGGSSWHVFRLVRRREAGSGEHAWHCQEQEPTSILHYAAPAGEASVRACVLACVCVLVVGKRRFGGSILVKFERMPLQGNK